MLKPKWQCLCAGFLEWFMQYEVEAMCSSMIASVCTLAGLGKPPQSYTTNGNESLNNLLKRKEKILSDTSGHVLMRYYMMLSKSNKQSLRRPFLAKANMKCFLSISVFKFHI